MAKSKTAYSASVQQLLELFGKLPGVGARSAERMVFHLLKADPAEALALSDAIRAVKTQVRHCSVCYNLCEAQLCDICQDASRDGGIICIVEQPKDLLQIESTGAYRGVYHVLLGHLSPLDGIGPEHLTIEPLLERIAAGGTEGRPVVREIILATNPNMDGDGTALYLQSRLADANVNITRLARGLPTGAQIEYSNKAILSDAISGRTKM